MIHHTVGVYANGSMKTNGVAEEHLKDHIQYNLNYRPGRALFVDGVCIYEGACSKETLAKAADLIKTFEAPTRCTAPYQ